MISVVVPVFNEENAVDELHRRLVATLRAQAEPFELIFVNDCSTDRTRERIRALSPRVLVSFAQNAGDTAAIDAGLTEARGDTIVLIDGDLQDAPEDISLLLAKIREGYGAVLGHRTARKERRTRIIFSYLANLLTSLFLGMRIHDVGCGLKAFRAEYVKGFRLWGRMQVYLVAVARARGARVCEVAVTHCPRRHGSSHMSLRTMLKAGLGLIQVLPYRYLRPPYRSAPPLWRISERVGAAPRIAIIGGGIFGATAALMLSQEYNVTLFERRPKLLGEATFVNQYRHHFGFHYPRSSATIDDIQKSRADFEEFYAPAIFQVPSYYAVSREGSLTPPDAYIDVFKRHHIPFEENIYPPEALLNRSEVSVCLKTPEAVYDYAKLCKLVQERIRKNPRIQCRLGTEVVGAALLKNGTKTLSVRAPHSVYHEEFDVVINATYARYNEFCRWLGFPQKNLSFRLKEIVLLECTLAEKAAVTVVDGPFATFLPTSADGNLYTLGDVPLSVHASAAHIASASVEDARWGRVSSRQTEIRKRCARWFPFVPSARYIESRFVVLPVEEGSEKRDDRPSELTRHGNGCWSIFSGKILTSVSVAREILRALEKQIP